MNKLYFTRVVEREREREGERELALKLDGLTRIHGSLVNEYQFDVIFLSYRYTFLFGCRPVCMLVHFSFVTIPSFFFGGKVRGGLGGGSGGGVFRLGGGRRGRLV